MSPSRTADALIAKAEECYELGLIDTSKLELVTRRALSEPGYNAILELPLDFELEEAHNLERRAAKRDRKQRRINRLRHIFRV